jgi:kinetochore protein NDC80
VRLLIKFLMDSGFSRDMTPKLLSAPTLKDFQLMFQFLYGKVDPNYKWTPGKKFEEEFLVLLKALKYPFAEQITKTQLQSVGSPHTWPVLLAVLIWMIELIMVSQQIEYEGDMDDGNVDGNEIFHVYLVKTYNEYLQGVENVGFSEELNELFHQKDELALNDIKRLDEENAELNTEWTKLKQETPPLVKIKQEKQNYESDIVKLNQWKEALLKKKSQIEEQLKSLNNDYEHLNNQLEKCASEKMELQQIVDNQELSPADIDRMNNERDQLSQQFDVLSEKLKETSKYVWQLEIDANKKMSLIEKQGKIFNDKCYHVELLPKNAKFAKGKNYEFKLMMSQVEKIKTSIDLKQFARDTLLNLNSALKTNTMKEEETTSELKDETDKTVEKIMDKNDSVRDLEARVANVEEQYETEKQVSFLRDELH